MSKTKIVHEKPGEPTTIVVPPGCTAIVFGPNGSFDMALLPNENSLEPVEGSDDVYANEGMMRFMCIMLAANDPDVRELVQRKMNEDSSDSKS